jgi:energy-coupling factor transporter ATP-binding protein EcfA2
MIRELTIKNYKSILDHTLELGRINVFIGENGCGKTNILEAVAMAAAALTNKLEVEDLWNRGMRVAKPSLMKSSFANARAREIILRCRFDSKDPPGVKDDELRISAKEADTGEFSWSVASVPDELNFKVGHGGEEQIISALLKKKSHSGTDRSPGMTKRLQRDIERVLGTQELALMSEWLEQHITRVQLCSLLEDFAVYNANPLALRGLQAVSRRTPLGIYGESLDLAISKLKRDVWADVLERARCVSWLNNIVVDASDTPKYKGHKLGGSQSALYFYDKYMHQRNNVFSAENVNEGILHVLFHLVLFVSDGTPKVVGIDNIETSLNPQLCRDLMKQLVELSAKYEKQALITTHNPAILDGLNLHDEDQRLFVVSRDDEGHTVTERIRLKPKVEGAPFKYKLSEMWMRGLIGGLPPEKF